MASVSQSSASNNDAPQLRRTVEFSGHPHGYLSHNSLSPPISLGRGDAVGSGCGRDSAFGSSLLCKDQGRYLRDSSWWETTGINVCPCLLTGSAMTSNPTIQYLLSCDTCLPSQSWCRCPWCHMLWRQTSWSLSRSHGSVPSHPTMAITPGEGWGVCYIR